MRKLPPSLHVDEGKLGSLLQGWRDLDLAVGVDWEEETCMFGGLGDLVPDIASETSDTEYESARNLIAMKKRRLR